MPRTQEAWWILSGWIGALNNTSQGTAYVEARSGGTVLIPNVTSMHRVSLTIRGAGVIPTGQLTALTQSQVTVDGAPSRSVHSPIRREPPSSISTGGQRCFRAQWTSWSPISARPPPPRRISPVEVVWEVTNRGIALTNGVWSDALFLSADNAVGRR